MSQPRRGEHMHPPKILFPCLLSRSSIIRSLFSIMLVWLSSAAFVPSVPQPTASEQPKDKAYGGQVSIAWDPVGYPRLAGYKLYIGYSPHHYAFAIDVGNHTSYALANLDSWRTY